MSGHLGRAMAAVMVLLAMLAGIGQLQGMPSVRASDAIDTASLLHNGHDTFYRTPFGAVKAGTTIILRLRTAHAGATAVTLHVDQLDRTGKPTSQSDIPMQVTSSDASYDYWQTTFAPSAVGFYGYRFQIANGTAQTAYVNTGFGGTGVATPTGTPSRDYTITSYQKDFSVPGWMKNAVMYQIFPDRFYNGDKSNDHKLIDPAYDGLHPIVHTNPNDPPTDSVDYGQLDFYGGDLQGIIDKLPYLKKLGINVLYLNPIFLAPTNHKYDTANYRKIDPHFGTLKTFKTLIKDSHARGIKVILDGVFNHTSSDSIYFNKYGHWKSVGAYQSKDSPYYSWYTFTNWPRSYNPYFGIDTLPALSESDAVKNFIYRDSNSIAQYWLKQGADGWRLDHAAGKSVAFWEGFRQSVKPKFKNDVIICECDLDTQTNGAVNLLGDQFDGDMNYAFRSGVLSFYARGKEGLYNRAISPSVFMDYMLHILEEYPLPAIYASMNTVGTHDTDRVIDMVNGSVAEMKQIAAFQMTWLGMPEIYYGDEAGLGGSGEDPNKRKFFPWSHPNKSLQAFYRKVINLRDQNQALRDGHVTPLLTDDASRVLAYLRQDKKQAIAVAVNDDAGAHDVVLRTTAFKHGTVLKDALSGHKYTYNGSRLTLHMPGVTTAILIPQRKK